MGTKRKRFGNLQYSGGYLSRRLIPIGKLGACACKFPSSILPCTIKLPILFLQSPFFVFFITFFILNPVLPVQISKTCRVHYLWNCIVWGSESCWRWWAVYTVGIPSNPRLPSAAKTAERWTCGLAGARLSQLSLQIHCQCNQLSRLILRKSEKEPKLTW